MALRSDAYGSAFFDGRIQYTEMGRLRLCRICATPHRVLRANLSSSPDSRGYKVVIQVRGTSTFEQCGRSAVLARHARDACRFETAVGPDAGDERQSVAEIFAKHGEAYFRAAEPLLGELSFDARFPTLLMGGVYATVLQRLRRDPLVVLQRRLSLTKKEKLLVVARRMLLPHFL